MRDTDVVVIFPNPYRSLDPWRTIGQSLIEAPGDFALPPAQATQEACDLMAMAGLPANASERYPTGFPARSVSGFAVPAP